MSNLANSTIKMPQENYGDIVKRLEKSCEDMKWYLSYGNTIWREEVETVLRHRERELEYFKKLYIEEEVEIWKKKQQKKRLCWLDLKGIFGKD